jgi:hypothetical protein
MGAAPARPLPPAVRDKLGKLLPMLSSSHDGERVGAVAAIERVLKNHDRDWHDLAATLGGDERPRAYAADDASTAVRAEDLVNLITKIRDSGARFGPRSEDFLDSLLGRARDYAFVFISPKQQRWLDDLVRKATPATP